MGRFLEANRLRAVAAVAAVIFQSIRGIAAEVPLCRTRLLTRRVATDGSAKYQTVQDAINAAPQLALRQAATGSYW